VNDVQFDPGFHQTFDRINSEDAASIQRIADWYFQEWTIAPETTRKKLSALPAAGYPFHLLMSAGNVPVATGGLYEHVGLLDIAPRFRVYGPWLALVFTTPENRKKGYGTLLCKEIQNQARDLGLKELFLFTHTAESLYMRMGWTLVESVQVKDGPAAVAVMKKAL
jgi:GNAT superfamily N-acetyltransferase